MSAVVPSPSGEGGAIGVGRPPALTGYGATLANTSKAQALTPRPVSHEGDGTLRARRPDHAPAPACSFACIGPLPAREQRLGRLDRDRRVAAIGVGADRVGKGLVGGAPPTSTI